jgi:hypothetical protein
MSKKKEPIEEEETIEYPVSSVDINGVNFSVSIHSPIKDIKRLTNLAIATYEYLISLDNGHNPGVQ